MHRFRILIVASVVAPLSAVAQARLTAPQPPAPFVGPPAPPQAPKPAAKPASPRPKVFEALLARGANPKGAFARVTSFQRDSIVAGTRALLGVRYKWAGSDPVLGLDCSGVVKYVFAKLGIDLPHHAADLAKLGGAVKKDTAAMEPGDLLVFGRGASISHVGIYVGDGMMIHASSASRRVVESPVLTYRPAAGVQWQGVRRVIAHDTASTHSE